MMEVKTEIFLGDCKEVLKQVPNDSKADKIRDEDAVFDHFYIQNNKLLFE